VGAVDRCPSVGPFCTCGSYLGWFSRSGGFYRQLCTGGTGPVSVPEWLTPVAQTHVKRARSPHGHSMALLFSFRGTLDCNKATLPLWSHWGIQCEWLLELAPSVLGSFILTDGVRLTA